MTLDSLHVQSVPLSDDFTLFESLATYVLLLLLSVWTSVSRQFIYNTRIWSLEIAVHVNLTTLPACNGKSLSVVIKGPLISANGDYFICRNLYSKNMFWLKYLYFVLYTMIRIPEWKIRFGWEHNLTIKHILFGFLIVHFPSLWSNISAAPTHGVYISRLIRTSRSCIFYHNFHDRE